MADTALDFLLENMKQLINSSSPIMFYLEEQMVCLYEEMQFLRKFLMDSMEARTEHEEVRDLVVKITDVTCEIDNIIDSFILIPFVQREASMSGIASIEDFKFSSDNFTPWLSIEERKMINHLKDIKNFAENRVGHGLGGVMEEINSIKTKVMEIYSKNMCGVGVLRAQKSSYGASASSRATCPVVEEETMVGMDDERIAIIEQLTAAHQSHLKVIPIIGMPGLGKTTLARKVYNDPFVVYHFHVHAWTCVSQEYQKRDLLLSILISAQLIQSHCTEIDKMGAEELGEKLYKDLKGKKYLLVVDDIWDIEAWNVLKIYFPDDKNGSRVMFTSRHVDVAVHAKPQYLRFLNENESWDLLQKKVFGKKCCPHELIGIGKQIAKKCGGLPLAILMVSGLLAKSDKTQDWWKHVSQSVSSYIVSDPEKYMDTLALSYNYLPRHLKACFLYLGVFPEDYEIPVQTLIWLYIAEGFIRQNEEKSLEEVAEEYLMDLIERSLVVVSQKSFNGKIRTCRIHDLLRDLCLKKAQEENFLQEIRYDHTSSSYCFKVNKLRRICIHSQNVCYTCLKSCAPHVRSVLSIKFSYVGLSENLGSFVCQAFKLLRVLDLSFISFLFFPSEIGLLVHLRYIAVFLSGTAAFEPSISNLCNLETFIARGTVRWIKLPDDLWKMVKLRHLYTHSSRYYHCSCFEIPRALHPTSVLENLQSIGTLEIHHQGEEQILARIPNLRRLKCCISGALVEQSHFVRLHFLTHLEMLTVKYDGLETGLGRGGVSLPHVEEFPPNLKSLSLSGLGLHWEEMSILGRLPNLEALKLLNHAFEGPRWDTSDGGFGKLRFLKLKNVNLKQWNASSDHFPMLQKLMLVRCHTLEGIPHGLGDILTLETIQLWYCNLFARRSACKIQKQQHMMGNDGLNILIDRDEVILR